MKNILFLLTDDQRYNAIHGLGTSQLKTPVMDNLIANGATFTQAHIQGGTCAAICMPSRAMINTGVNIFSLQDEGSCIPNNHTTIGETFQKAGYNCFGTGKWHNGTKECSRNFTDGDNLFFGGMWDHWNVPANSYDPTGEYKQTIRVSPDFMNANHYFTAHSNKMSNGVHSTDLIADTTINYINSYSDDKPFYIYSAFMAPHDPRTMPDEFLNLYNADDIELPPNYMEQHPFDFGVSDIRDEKLEQTPRTEKAIKKHLAEYYGMISHLDKRIGDIIEALEAKNLLKDTIIVLAGDNGLAVGSHGLMGKQNGYEHSIRVPLIMSGPKIPKGVKIDSYVYLSDIFPTLCELQGIDIPASVECPSFAKMFTDATLKTRESMYFVYSDILRMVKNEQYKLIEYRNHINKTQLFDIINDPFELNDLSSNIQYEEIKHKLKSLMSKHRDELSELDNNFGKQFWKAI